MDELTVGTTITLIKEIDGSKPIGSTATVVYIDDFKQIFVDWSDGSQGQFTEEQLSQYFEIPTKIAYPPLAAGRNVGCCIYVPTTVTVSLVTFSIFLFMSSSLL